MDRIYCGELLPDGTRCRGVHSCTPNTLGWVETCTNKYCTFKKLHHNRRVALQPIEHNDRRKV